MKDRKAGEGSVGRERLADRGARGEGVNKGNIQKKPVASYNSWSICG